MRRLAAAWGYLAFTEAVWRTTDAPLEVREAFADYPTMGRVEDVVPLIQEIGLSLVDHVDLPDEAWWDDFYSPMERQMEKLRAATYESIGLANTAVNAADAVYKGDQAYSVGGSATSSRTGDSGSTPASHRRVRSCSRDRPPGIPASCTTWSPRTRRRAR